MAGQSIDNEYFLVSDSNEVNNQLDSRKLSWDDLAEMAQNELFRRHLGIMDRYITKSQYDMYKTILDDNISRLNGMWNATKDGKWSGMFQPVDGQVILVYKDDVPAGQSAEEYIRSHWDIPPDGQLIQMKDCMIRGVTFMSDGTQTVKRQSNQNVSLVEENMPPHMHHSSVTTGSSIQTIRGGSSGRSKPLELGTRYDMFYNDSIDTGLAKNELEGTADEFAVQSQGSDEMIGDVNVATHNNLPNYHRCFVFEVRLNTTQG